MTKQYKQPEETKVEENSVKEVSFLRDFAGSIFLNLSAPTTVPTGKPTRLVDQMRYVLVEGSPVSAGSLVTGTIYKITTVGTSDFTLVGARINQLNTYFVATGTTTGTGSGTSYTVRLYFYIPIFDVWKYTTLT